MASGGGGGPPAAPPSIASFKGFTRHTKTTCAIMGEDDESSFGDDDSSANSDSDYDGLDWRHPMDMVDDFALQVALRDERRRKIAAEQDAHWAATSSAFATTMSGYMTSSLPLEEKVREFVVTFHITLITGATAPGKDENDDEYIDTSIRLFTTALEHVKSTHFKEDPAALAETAAYSHVLNEFMRDPSTCFGEALEGGAAPRPEKAPVIATATQIGSEARATEKKRIKHAKDKENARSRALATADAKAAAKPTADAYSPVGQNQLRTLSKKSSGGNPLVDSSTGEVHHATTTDLEITLKTIVSSSSSPLVNRSATAAVSAADSRSTSTSTITAVSGLETALSSLRLTHGTSRA